LGSPELTGVHRAPCLGALWWEGTFSALCPGPPALPAVLRRGGRRTGPQEPHLQTPNVPRSSCQSPWPHVAQRTSHGNGPPVPRHSGVFKNQDQKFYQQLEGFGFCPRSQPTSSQTARSGMSLFQGGWVVGVSVVSSESSHRAKPAWLLPHRIFWNACL